MRELATGAPTLVVAIASRGSSDEMQAWFDAADHRAPEAARVSIISLRLPFFISDGYARGRARGEVPQRWWSRTLFDKNGELARALGIEGDGTWVMAVDADGSVRAAIHAPVDAASAEAIWQALAPAR